VNIRTLSTLAVGVLAAATLAACSDNDAADTTEVTPPADSMATTPAEPMPPATTDPAMDPNMPADGMTPPPVNDPAAMDPAATSPATETPPAP